MPTEDCPIYLINLAGATQRLSAMRAQLDALGLPFQVVEAVAGRALSQAELSRLYDARGNRRRFYRALAPGEIGCYASHIRCWTRMAEQGCAQALVLEDDVQLLPALTRWLARIDRLPPGWDMVKLISRSRDRRRAQRSLGDGLQLLSYRRIPSLSGAYLISAAGAAKLLRRVPPFARPVDVDFRHGWEFGLNVLGCDPYPVARSAAAGATTIGGRDLPPGLLPRLRKWHYQLRYSWQNWRHPQRLLDGTAAAGR